MPLTVNHDRVAQRFSLVVDGHECELVYRQADGRMTIVHTGVPREIEGRGLAAELMKSALELARGEGWKIIPACSYARGFFQRHGEYSDLLA